VPCRGQAKPQNHNKRLLQHQATQAGTSEKISCQLQASWAEGGSGKPSQANGAVSLVGLQNQNKRFWVPIAIKFFQAGKLRFLEKNS
jgi:hypothetical protein